MELHYMTRVSVTLTKADCIALDAFKGMHSDEPDRWGYRPLNVSAIKYMRARFDLGLADAKRAWEAYRDGTGQ
jgi:hypothetical protein